MRSWRFRLLPEGMVPHLALDFVGWVVRGRYAFLRVTQHLRLCVGMFLIAGLTLWTAFSPSSPYQSPAGGFPSAELELEAPNGACVLRCCINSTKVVAAKVQFPTAALGESLT